MKREQFNKKVEEAKNLAKNLKEDFVQGYNEETKHFTPVQKKVLTWSLAGLGVIILMAFFVGGGKDEKKENESLSVERVATPSEVELDKKESTKTITFNGKTFSIDEVNEGYKILREKWMKNCKPGKVSSIGSFYDFVKKTCDVDIRVFKKRVQLEKENRDLFLLSGAILAADMFKNGNHMETILAHTAPEYSLTLFPSEMFDLLVLGLETDYANYEGDDDNKFWYEYATNLAKSLDENDK